MGARGIIYFYYSVSLNVDRQVIPAIGQVVNN